VGRSNGIMAGIAKQYSTAEMREIAKYLGSLDGEMKVVTQPRFK
jgi:cytochrome c553